ncbi:GNAT family N-acetyltransferase [Nocardiopsis exhalans]|uniref:GNAT family N-acetyltransferase n=1 Tax=Nocardiopsis exhalans TaxID=163604 RepID=A0ABY5D6X8_9ACTN|nr:GNAT family N-acetyltransferase [Nocardiopsis exhalans]USY18838.1 GNAT family N-acetyltransferase [Nocardiopsis exhalans]
MANPHGISRRTPETAPTPAEVESLYAAASAPPPLNEPSSTAALFARLYAVNVNRPDTIVLAAHEGTELIGFVYGYPWAWSEDDPWGQQLRQRLGEDQRELADSYAVPLLAVHPRAWGRGLGTALLSRIVEEAPGRLWLQTTDADTPALRLYLRQGWRRVGVGPDAPDGRPGAVFVR